MSPKQAVRVHLVLAVLNVLLAAASWYFAHKSREYRLATEALVKERIRP